MDNDEMVTLDEALDFIWKPNPGQYERMEVMNREPRGQHGVNRTLWIALMRRDGGRCWMCSSSDGHMVIDHLRPRSNWPADELHLADRSDNLRMACWACNDEKSNRNVPFVAPLPVVWNCRAEPAHYREGFFTAFCSEHSHVCRVPMNAPIVGLRA